MILDKVTFTGADDKTDIQQMALISMAFPHVEWGILIGNDDRTGGPRYPSLSWQKDYYKFSAFTSTSIHACGKYARALMKGEEVLQIGDIGAERVQLNIALGSPKRKISDNELAFALESIENSGAKAIIQINSLTEEVQNRMRYLIDVDFIFDASGGRGVLFQGKLPKFVSYPDTMTYAGGLGLDTADAMLHELSFLYSGPQKVAIDMETKVRDDNDELDLKLCRKILQSVDRWIGSD